MRMARNHVWIQYRHKWRNNRPWTARTRCTCVAPALLLLTSCFNGPGFWDRRGTIDAVEFSPRGGTIAVGGRYVGTGQFDDHGDVLLYVSKSGCVQNHINLNHRVTMIAFDPTDSYLAVAADVIRSGPLSRDCVSVYSISQHGEPELLHSTGDVSCVDQMMFSPDGRFLVRVAREIVTFIRTDTWQLDRTIDGRYFAAQFNNDGRLLALLKWDQGVTEVWNVQERRRVAEIPGGWPLTLDASGKWWLAFDFRRAAIVFWDIQEQAEDFILPVPGSTCRDIATSEAGQLAAIVSEDRRGLFGKEETSRLCVWDIAARSLSHPPVVDAPFEFSGGLAFLAHGELLAISAYAGAKIRDPRSGRLIKALPEKMGSSLVARDDMVATDTGESIAVWRVDGKNVTLLWEDRWRLHRWSPLE